MSKAQDATKTLSARIPTALYLDAKKAAKEMGISFNDFAVMALERKLGMDRESLEARCAQVEAQSKVNTRALAEHIGSLGCNCPKSGNIIHLMTCPERIAGIILNWPHEGGDSYKAFRAVRIAELADEARKIAESELVKMREALRRYVTGVNQGFVPLEMEQEVEAPLSPSSGDKDTDNG
jgi:hypothetical protein